MCGFVPEGDYRVATAVPFPADIFGIYYSPTTHCGFRCDTDSLPLFNVFIPFPTLHGTAFWLGCVFRVLDVRGACWHSWNSPVLFCGGKHGCGIIFFLGLLDGVCVVLHHPVCPQLVEQETVVE